MFIILDCLCSHSGCLVLLFCDLVLVTSGCSCLCMCEYKNYTITYTHLLAYMLACEMLVILNTLDTLSIGGYVSSLSQPKTSKSNKLYFDFKLNCGIESVKCVCFDIDKHPFFLSINGHTDMGAHNEQCNSTSERCFC